MDPGTRLLQRNDGINQLEFSGSMTEPTCIFLKKRSSLLFSVRVCLILLLVQHSAPRGVMKSLLCTIISTNLTPQCHEVLKAITFLEIPVIFVPRSRVKKNAMSYYTRNIRDFGTYNLCIGFLKKKAL